MSVTTLSGGLFGGTEISIQVTTDIISMEKDGVFWNYSYALNPATTTAEFIGCSETKPENALHMKF